MRKIILLSLLLMTLYTSASAQSINLRCYQSRVLQSPYYHYYNEDFTIKIQSLNLNKRQIVEFGYPLSTIYTVTFETSQQLTNDEGKQFLIISGEVHNYTNEYTGISIILWSGTSDVWVFLNNSSVFTGERKETVYYCKTQRPSQKPY
jgi:hypothetical protein